MLLLANLFIAHTVGRAYRNIPDTIACFRDHIILDCSVDKAVVYKNLRIVDIV